MSNGAWTVSVEVLALGSPESSAPYSPGIVAGAYAFLAGQIGEDPVTHATAETAEGQTRQALENLRNLLKDSGLDSARVVSVTVFLTRREDASGMNAAFLDYFAEPRPARTTVVVAALGRPELLVELQAIAHIDVQP